MRGSSVDGLMYTIAKLHMQELVHCECAFFPRMENLHTKKTSNGSNFGWLIRQMSINQKVGGRRFVEGLYQALFSFGLARRNVIYKAKRKLNLISGYLPRDYLSRFLC